jgi:phosphonate degradation associated HDIG domain protein
MFEAVRREIAEIYTTRAHKAYGLEGISQLAHALQSAHAAERAGAPPGFILAALLHDIGQMTNGLGENPAADGIDNRHEHVGADWLAARLPAAVSEPVRLHVEAKRYLCATDRSYAGKLAGDSVLSLKLQGGPMSEAECGAFLRRPFAHDALALRRLDDEAKLSDCATPPLEHFLGYLDRLTSDPIGADARAAFAAQGFLVLRDFFSRDEQQMLEETSSAFGDAAHAVMRRAIARGITLADYARDRRDELIVVAEAHDPIQVCRFEYLLGANADLADFAAARIAPIIACAAGERYIPFKDKENEKHPGGGAFRPHQDFAAYQAFGPRYNVTAMISVDGQTRANGCLSFATNLDEAARDAGTVAQWVEGRPLLHFYDGGPKNGDVRDDIVARLSWRGVETAPGDLVIFDSFVPHRSEPNMTSASRRAMFLTYAPAREGDWYARYYADKRANYAAARFHVSTPTAAV